MYLILFFRNPPRSLNCIANSFWKLKSHTNQVITFSAQKLQWSLSLRKISFVKVCLMLVSSRYCKKPKNPKISKQKPPNRANMEWGRSRITLRFGTWRIICLWRVLCLPPAFLYSLCLWYQPHLHQYLGCLSSHALCCFDGDYFCYSQCCLCLSLLWNNSPCSVVLLIYKVLYKHR